jgi:GTP-binding protein
MIPADSDDLQKEHDILLNELQQYNPELVEKQRILAITKCDMLDEELLAEIKTRVPKDIQTVFISSLSGQGITELKDLIWTEINKESNKVVEITHRPMQIVQHDIEEDDIDEELEEDEDDDLSKYKGIGWDEL